VNNLRATSTGEGSQRPWNMETLFEFQLPQLGVSELQSSGPLESMHRAIAVKLIYDAKVIEGVAASWPRTKWHLVRFPQMS
jgi:hypothetical protein